MLSILRNTSRRLLRKPTPILSPGLTRPLVSIMPPMKRKRSAADASGALLNNGDVPALKRRTSARNAASAAIVNPVINGDILDGPNATRASPDSDVNEDIVPGPVKQEHAARSESPLSDVPPIVEPPKSKGRGRKTAVKTEGADAETSKPAKKSRARSVKVEVHETGSDAVVDAPKAATKGKGKQKIKHEDEEAGETADVKPTTKKANKKADDEFQDPEAEHDEEVDEEDFKQALARPPPVHSDYLPLPWRGRLGYACLNTYLRNSTPPIFCSRTCRIQSILEHRHPLQDPSQPEHATKNRPDPSKPADVALGQRYLEQICLANVYDLPKMLRWNDRYNIKFLRLSSEMFPFASHPEYGYPLAPFAAEALAEVGKLGSPRQSVIENAIRDLNYHDEMLSLLKLPEQENRDAVMIMHMGGLFEGKAETLQRFRENYPKLSQSVKNRLVLENDDMGWSVHDLLPVCEELNIPMVLDYHHHNIVFDASQIREGTKDIMDLYPRIKATWDRKGIRQKMHYSEPTPPAITPHHRRKHNPRVATLPPCAPDMDLMIEAKDKEQAVFELMRTFKLPGYDTFNDILPHLRPDDNKVALATMNRKKKKADEPEPELVPDADIGMGGPEGRVYWPPGMDEWLRPKKREVKKKDPDADAAAVAKKEKTKKAAAEAYAAREAEKKRLAAGGTAQKEESDSDINATPATKKAKAAMRKKAQSDETKAAVKKEDAGKAGAKKVKKEPLPTPSDEDEEPDAPELHDDEDEDEDEQPVTPAMKRTANVGVGGKARGGGRGGGGGRRAKAKRVSYAEDDDEDDMEME
nr:uv-damage endonuclease [Quercus suber]